MLKENEIQKEIRKRIMAIPVVQQVSLPSGEIVNLIVREEILSTLLSDIPEKIR